MPRDIGINENSKARTVTWEKQGIITQKLQNNITDRKVITNGKKLKYID